MQLQVIALQQTWQKPGLLYHCVSLMEARYEELDNDILSQQIHFLVRSRYCDEKALNRIVYLCNEATPNICWVEHDILIS